MSARRRPLLPLVLLVAVAACGSGSDAPEKPERLHAPPVTPDLVPTRGERPLEAYERQVLLINKWIRQSGISPTAAVVLLDAVRQSRNQTGLETSLHAAQLVQALEVWLKAARTKDSTHQAAAYLIADRVLVLAWRPFQLTNLGQKPARDELKTVGAESFVVEATTEAEYTGDWLHYAIQLDPHGPMGQRAVLVEFETTCAGGSLDSYHSIVERLERLIANPADSEVRFTAQVLEADAYRDVVALAHGFGKENADSTVFLPEADADKAKALAVYEAALATADSTARLTRGARLAHDRLASGQRLDQTRFFCLGE